MSHHDALDAAMFWTGALLALAPLLFAAVVIGVWWWQKRRGLDAESKSTRGFRG